jgi:hypothetical protein
MKKMYIAMVLVTEHALTTGAKIQLSWADGMIGVTPIFSSKAAARKYYGKDIPLSAVMEQQKEGK